MYKYNAYVDKVVDGDTIFCTVDLGFKIFVKEKFRFAIINAPEMSTPEGSVSKGILEQKILNKNVILNVDKQDKYGRWLVTVFIGDENINEFMLQNGYAVKYGE